MAEHLYTVPSDEAQINGRKLGAMMEKTLSPEACKGTNA